MKLITIIGARPQFIKAAAVSREISLQSDIQECVVHTGQHYDSNMSEVFFEELDIPKPDFNLGIGGGSHGKNTGRMIEQIENVLDLDMVTLERNAALIVTDSGGIQKEAYFHKVPCVTLRNEAEWVELVEIGANMLSGTEYQAILNAVTEQRKKTGFDIVDGLYGTGDAASEFVSILRTRFQISHNR